MPMLKRYSLGGSSAAKAVDNKVVPDMFAGKYLTHRKTDRKSQAEKRFFLQATALKF